MLYADEIIIECSCKQSQISNGTSSWVNTIPTIILEEGDIIKTLGSWVSVRNSGDASIEIYNKLDPTQDTVNASFKFNFYKTMDAKNIVSFPYHSTKLNKEEQNLLGYGFTQSLTDDNYLYNDTNIPSVIVSPTTTKNITELCRYDDLIHEPNSDKFDSTVETYANFMINKDLRQGMRDLANTGNQYTLMYKTKNGNYELVEREVSINIPKGFYSPSALGSFITSEMNQVYFNEVVDSNINETMSNNGRYFVGMTPIALPQLNITNGWTDFGGDRQLYEKEVGIVSSGGDTLSATYVGYSVGMSKYNIEQYQLLESTTIDDVFYVSFKFIPKNAQDLEDFNYIQKMIDIYCDVNSGWYQKTEQTYASPVGYAFAMCILEYDSNLPLYIYVDDKNPYDNGRFIYISPDETHPYGYFTGSFQNYYSFDLNPDFLKGGIMIGNSALDTGLAEPVVNEHIEYSPIGMPVYVGQKTEIKNVLMEDGNTRTIYVNGKSAYNFFTFSNKTQYTSNNLGIDGNVDYAHANRYIGATYGNYNRWSLMNNDEPPAFENPDDVNLQPILRKYPNFMKYGMLLPKATIKFDGTTLNPMVTSQYNKETDMYNKVTLYNGNFDAWREFIVAQINDGLIDINQQITYKNQKFFYAYAHFMIDSQSVAEEQLPLPEGSDDAIRNRPRGVVILIHYDSFISNGLIKTDFENYNKGVIYGAGYVAIKLYSFVKEKLFRTAPFEGCLDYNYVEDVNNQIVFADNLSDMYDPYLVNFAFGYSYKKSGWRNFTAMLCSTEMESKENTNIIFGNNNRMSTTEADWGYVSYNPRIFIGSRSPSLSFDDITGRFNWSMFYTPQQLSNEYNQGLYATGSALQPSVQLPFQTLIETYAENFTRDEEETDPKDGWSVQFELNQLAGSDIIQYNKKKWNIYDDGFIILAPEITKHKTVLNTTVPMSSYITGYKFDYIFPVNTDYTQRFFCYDQDVRYNTFKAGYILTSEEDSNTGLYGRPIAPIENYYGDDTLNTLIMSKGWGCMPTDLGFIERKYEAGTIRPNPQNIYDTMCGVQVYSWGVFNETNWDLSFWKTLGFELRDLKVEPFQYCSQIRNFTTNFLTVDKTTYPLNSYPMRTDGELITSGFVSINTNIMGALQYQLKYPRTTYIGQGGIPAVNNLVEQIVSFEGGNIITDATGTDNSLDGGTVILSSNAGASEINNQLVNNDFYIIEEDVTYGTKIEASQYPNKLKSPFYLVRSSLPDDNYKYLNNSVQNAILPVVSVANKQYGATSDFYYSDDFTDLTFTNRRKRVLNEIKIEITDNDGNLATTLSDNSSIFFKIIRRSPNPDVALYPNKFDSDDLVNLERKLDKKQMKLYQDEIDDLFN